MQVQAKGRDHSRLTLEQRRQLDELFTRVQQGETQVFRDLHSLVARPLMAYCLYLTRETEKAKDLFQQVMMTVFERRDQYTGGNLLGWIFTIARNTGRTWGIRESRFEPLADHFDVEDEGSDAIEEMDRKSIMDAVDRLPDDFRRVIILYYFGQMSVAEVAGAENIGDSLVKARLMRARAILKYTLRSQHGERE